METNGMQFKRIMLNVLLADPLTTKGKGALTSLGIKISELEYLNDFYIEPFTLYNRALEEALDEHADPDMKYVNKVELNTLISKKDSFETRLKQLVDSLFVIKGGAGSGKTTYVHHLQQECDNIKFYFCDFEQSRKAISLFGIPYDFKEKYDNNVWKFISNISAQITLILFDDEIISKFGNHKEYIKKIYNIYTQYFSILKGPKTVVDEENMWEFFSVLHDYVNEDYTYSQLQFRLKELVVNKFNEFEDKKLHKEAVTYICGIIIRVLFCLSKASENMGIKKKYVCVIDNIEYFVPFDETHPIQECELQLILDGVYDSVTRIRPIINTWKELFDRYNTFFGFLLVTRDTSVSLADYRHYDDFMKESEINISTWFCADDIYEKKAKHFEHLLEELKENQFYIAYNNIIGDMSQYNWGMHDFICKMYNYNFRRIVFDVVNALSKQPESDIVYFNSKWKQCLENPNLQATKHLCRKFVFRMLLNSIQETNYFDDLLVEKRNASLRRRSTKKEESSYARKIATTLHRINLEEHLQNNNGFVDFPRIIKAVLKPPYIERPSKKQIVDLASILYLMNETRNEKTNWSPLIMIKFDSELVYNKENLASKMIEQWNAYINNNHQDANFEKYGVRITFAGSFFAKMVPDFEYFACRFAPDYPALMVRENLKSCKSKSGKPSYQCLELIRTVRDNAFQCIDEIIERDSDFFKCIEGASKSTNRFSPLYDRSSLYKWIYVSDKKNNSLISHPIRILNHQIGYLQHFREYVNELPEEQLASSDKENILLKLESEIRKYSNKSQSVVEKYPDYFNYQ